MTDRAHGGKGQDGGVRDGLGSGQHHGRPINRVHRDRAFDSRPRHHLPLNKTLTLLPPALPFVGISMRTERGCQ